MPDSSSIKNLTLPDAAKIDITFFVPCYNEEENIKATIDTITKAVKGASLTHEILIFDDASIDNTVDVVKSIQKKVPSIPVRLITNEEHRGLGFNYFRGSFFAQGKCYMLVNGDNVEPVETIKEIIRHYDKADMIIPYFGGNDQRSRFRRTTSWVFTKLVNFISGHKIEYYNGPVLHHTNNVRFWRAESVGYGYQAELLCRLLHEGFHYIQVEVWNADRERGFTKAFALGNIFSVSNSLFHIFWRRLEYGAFRLLKPGMTKTGK